MGVLNKTDKSFKTLINKRFTTDGDVTDGKKFFQEEGADTLNIHSREVWTTPVPTDPNAAVTEDIAIYYDKFVLTPDPQAGSDNSNQQAWFFQSGSNFTPFNDGYNDSFTQTDFIGDKYGSGYTVELYQNDDTQVYPTNPINWIFDYKVGVLHIANPNLSHSRPYKVSVYQYIGKTLSASVNEEGLLNAVGFPYSGSDNLTGKPSQAVITGSLFLSGSGHITSSGNISASGYIITNNITASNNISASGYIIVNNITASENISSSGYIVTNNITASNNISSSGYIIANNITASNISASGNVNAHSFSLDGLQFLSTTAVVTSASTQFGDALSDKHGFSGSVFITNSLSLAHANSTDYFNVSESLALASQSIYYATASIGHLITSASDATASIGHLITSASDATASISAISQSIANIDIGISSFSNVASDITPLVEAGALNNASIHSLGTDLKKWKDIYAVNTFFGGIHEINLETKGLDKMQEGTVLTLRNGIMCPCENEADPLVMGIVSKGENYPIILGAEPVLVTGKVKEGDYIITSKTKGHGKGINPQHIYDKQLFGKIIAQAIESGKGESYTIKAMIRKM